MRDRSLAWAILGAVALCAWLILTNNPRRLPGEKPAADATLLLAVGTPDAASSREALQKALAETPFVKAPPVQIAAEIEPLAKAPASMSGPDLLANPISTISAFSTPARTFSANALASAQPAPEANAAALAYPAPAPAMPMPAAATPVAAQPAPNADKIAVRQEDVKPAPRTRTIRARITAYCPCSRCCGEFANGRTSIGKNAWRPGVASAPAVIPYGSIVEIPGYGTVKVDDTGLAMRESWRKKGLVHLDVRYNYHWQAEQWGTKVMNVKVTDPE